MLKYSLLPLERAFAFQITEQSSSIKDAINGPYVGGSFMSSNGWVVKIDSCPEIRVPSRTIYLRGSSQENNLRVDRTWNFSSNFERDQAISEIKFALDELISLSNTVNYLIKSTNQITIIGNAPEALTVLADPYDTEEGWGTNRLKHSKPVHLFQG
jgi:hypothetical protein